MRRRLILVGAVAAALGALAVAPASSISKPQVFSLLDVSGPETALDPGGGFNENEIPKLGARFTFTDALYKWAGRKRGARVGRIDGLCTFTKVDLQQRSVTVFCNATAYLPAGQILFAASIRFAENGPSSFQIPIIGGTGSYAGARGYMKNTNLGDSGNSNDEFHLLP